MLAMRMCFLVRPVPGPGNRSGLGKVGRPRSQVLYNLKSNRWRQHKLPPLIHYELAPKWLRCAAGRSDLGFHWLANIACKHSRERTVTLTITHSKWASPDHFEALGFDDAHPNMVIRFDYAPQTG